MSKPKKEKEYSNIFAIMIEHHNNVIVPFLKNTLNSGNIKISWRRCLQKRDNLESEKEESWYENGYEYFDEYLLLNKFILDLLDKDQVKTLLDMKNSDDSNITMAAHTLYNLIEDKKKEIIEKLKK